MSKRNAPKDTGTIDPRRIKVTGPDGKAVSLASLPLVAYALTCGHIGKQYAIVKGDIVFCDTCDTNKRVKRIIA